jgi:AraC-like DNA-binding protein
MALVLDYLGRLLLARVEVTHCHFRRMPGGFSIPPGVVPTPRVILVRSGQVQYIIEDQRLSLSAGMLLLVPARSRRQWSVPRSKTADIGWIEFRTGVSDRLLGDYVLLPDCNVSVESAAFRRVLHLYALKDPRHSLQAEGELKAILARFLSCASPSAKGAPARNTGATRVIAQAVEYLGENFSRPDVLAALPQRSSLSANHFRLLFKREIGMSAQQYVRTLRMRAARAYLQETELPIKSVAHAVGYADQLYFSRQYRRFWKLAPSADRVFRP